MSSAGFWCQPMKYIWTLSQNGIGDFLSYPSFHFIWRCNIVEWVRLCRACCCSLLLYKFGDRKTFNINLEIFRGFLTLDSCSRYILIPFYAGGPRFLLKLQNPHLQLVLRPYFHRIYLKGTLFPSFVLPSWRPSSLPIRRLLSAKETRLLIRTHSTICCTVYIQYPMLSK